MAYLLKNYVDFITDIMQHNLCLYFFTYFVKFVFITNKITETKNFNFCKLMINLRRHPEVRNDFSRSVFPRTMKLQEILFTAGQKLIIDISLRGK
jgi:hypothetical protein